MTDMEVRAAAWHETVLESLKSNDVRLVVYVPDNVLTPLIAALEADPFFICFACTREEEALGIVAGAWMASLAVPYQIPAVIFVSERGTLGEFNLGQSLVRHTIRPVLDSLAVEHHTITRQDEVAFIVDRSIKQAVATQAPVTLILSPLLTGGKVFTG
jgi:sulfopyruvate decarboxylase TPP-binding subunit